MSKWSDNPGWVTIIVFVIMFFTTIMVCTRLNMNKPNIPGPEDTFATECIKKGGNPEVRTGWENNIHVDEYKCEGV
jgi:hypothetical protein